MTTEAEAATKMCCGPLGGVNFTQSTNDPHRALTTCIGSPCMAWRWATGPDPVEPEPEPEPDTTEEPPTNPDREGYCGLAGKP